MPYHCLLCRKKVLAAKKKEAQAKNKAKKPAAKGGLKRAASQVSKSSPKARSVKETNGSPQVVDSDAQETSAAGKKEENTDNCGASKDSKTQLKNSKSSSADLLPSKSSL